LTLGDFQVVKKLGSGGMGAVYLAYQRSTQRPVALKLLSEELAKQASFVDRFRREAAVLATLQHVNIVTFIGAGEEKGIPFFAMELVEGFSAGLLVKVKGKQTVPDALFIVRQCAEALAYGHAYQIVHRDIKPENIMITRLGHIKIADLGLAKSLQQDLDITDTGVALGSPKYMAPEQSRNAKYADHRSDIYSLGGVLYYLLTGQAPFPGSTAMELLLAKERGRFASPRRLNTEVPKRLELIIDKMLAMEPRYRYANCAELIRNLDSLGLIPDHLGFNPIQVVPIESFQPRYDLVEMLMIHDDPEDIRLARQALEENSIPSNLVVVKDGMEGRAYLRREGKYVLAPQPDLIIIGRNLHSLDTLATLEEINSSDTLRAIPLIVLSNTPDAVQFLQSHGFQVSLTVNKPEDVNQFDDLIKSVQGLCLTVLERLEPSRP
jgi:serine/threonine protein kinase